MPAPKAASKKKKHHPHTGAHKKCGTKSADHIGSPKGWQNLRKKGYKLQQTTTRSVSSGKSHKFSLALLPCTHASSRIFRASWFTMFCNDHLPVRDTCKVPLERRGKKPDSLFTSHHPIAPLRSLLGAAQLNVKEWVHAAKPQTNDCGLETTRERKISACFFLSFAHGIATTHK